MNPEDLARYELDYKLRITQEDLRLANEANLTAIAALEAAAKSLRSAARMAIKDNDDVDLAGYCHNRAFVAEDALKTLKAAIGEDNES